MLQVLVGGLSAGSVYALIALALVVTYRTTRVPNFAQGEMGMISAFVAYALVTDLGVSLAVALTATLAFAFLLGIGFESLLLRRARDPSHMTLVLITLGFMLLLFGLAGWRWGGEQRALPFPIAADAVVRVGEVAISTLSLVTVVVATALMLAFFALFRFTRIGVAMRAIQDDPVAAQMSGIPTGRVGAITFGVSSVLGAVAALLIAPVVTLDPTLMWDPLLKGFAAAVLGGLSTPVGAVLGGYLLGIVENAFGAYVSIEFRSALAFLVIVGVLWVRPSGLLGRPATRRA